MMAPMISLRSWIVVFPLAIVNWNLHFSRISMVKTIAAAKVFISIEVLRIVDIRIMIEAFVVAIARSATPCSAICLSLRLSLLGLDVVI